MAMPGMRIADPTKSEFPLPAETTRSRAEAAARAAREGQAPPFTLAHGLPEEGTQSIYLARSNEGFAIEFVNMQTELRGSVPKLPISFAPTLIEPRVAGVPQAQPLVVNLYDSAGSLPRRSTGHMHRHADAATSPLIDRHCPALLAASCPPCSPITVRQFRGGALAASAASTTSSRWTSARASYPRSHLADPSGVASPLHHLPELLRGSCQGSGWLPGTRLWTRPVGSLGPGHGPDSGERGRFRSLARERLDCQPPLPPTALDPSECWPGWIKPRDSSALTGALQAIFFRLFQIPRVP